MSSNYDGTSGFKNDTVTGDKLDRISMWHGSSNPTAGTNDIPTNGLFLNTTDGIIYENTGTLASPTWTARTTGTIDPDIGIYPHSTTIGDYTQPTSATASSVADDTPSFQDDFSGADAWADADSTKIGVDTTDDRLEFICVRDTGNRKCVYDLGAGNVSDTAWILRCKLHFTSLTAGDNSNIYIGLSSASQTTAPGGAQDSIGCIARNEAASKLFVACDSDGAALSTSDGTTALTWAATTDYFIEIKRTSATTYNITLSSTSAFSGDLASFTGRTVAATTASLRYIVVTDLDDNAPGGTMEGYVDDVKFWNGVTTTTSTPASNVRDDNTGTQWRSLSENNPNIYVDMGSVVNIAAVAIHLDRTNTTETEITIQTSPDASTWTTKRTCNVSDFTDDTWEFRRINLTNTRYVRIRGSNSSKTLAINEIKVLKPTDGQVACRHGHKEISTSSTTDDDDG